jgi:hypothetical protein
MIEFGNSSSFLVVYKNTPQELGTVRIVPSIHQAITSWTSSTRISPIIPIVHDGYSSKDKFDFSERCLLYFINQSTPEDLPYFNDVTNKFVWLSLGIYNLVVSIPLNSENDKISEWLYSKKIPHECWTIENCNIKDIHSYPTEEKNIETDLKNLSNIIDNIKNPDFKSIVNDFLITIASIITRTKRDAPFLTDDFLKIVEFVKNIVESFKNEEEFEERSKLYGQLLYTNSGLAHFASQTFSGTTCIRDSSSNFSAHSLLGLGLPSIALWQVCKFVTDTLGKARIPTLISGYKYITKDIPRITEIFSDNDFWLKNHLDLSAEILKKIKIPEEPLFPLITHFSARDGFRSNLTTISAPLSCVTSCNTSSWSLLTLTHEISHIIVQSVLAHVLPDLDSKEEMEDACKLIMMGGQRPNLLMELRAFLLTIIIQIHTIGQDEKKKKLYVNDLKSTQLREIIDQWHHEVEEIFAHAFDFLYFYGRDANKYVLSLWSSWGTVPNVQSRIRNYVIRTICALCTLQFSRGTKGIEIAIDQTQDILKQMLASNNIGYLKKALEFTQTPKRDEIVQLVSPRIFLSNFVYKFLFSEKIATDLRSETALTGGATERNSYSLRPKKFEKIRIRNPITFIEQFSQAKEPSILNSAWIHSIIALNSGDRKWMT